MNYEFHVGDYVETWDGWIGYIQSVNEGGNSGLIIWTQGERAAKGIRCPFDRDSLDQYAKIIGTYNKELEAKNQSRLKNCLMNLMVNQFQIKSMSLLML